MLEFEVKLIPVVIAAFAPMVMGALWYSPLVFGNVWLRLIGKKQEEIEGSSTDYALSFGASLVTAFFLSVLIHSITADPDLLDGALIGLIIGVGLRAMSTMVYSTFEGPPYRVWVLYAAYDSLALAIMGGIVTLF